MTPGSPGTPTASDAHARPAGEVLAGLGSGPGGLGEAEATVRLARYGPNRLPDAPGEGLLSAFLDEVREPLILLLIGTGVLYSVWGRLVDALTIFGVIALLLLAEVLNERRAARAVQALRRMAEPEAAVRREGLAVFVSVEEIVPGDLVLLEPGRRVPADLRLREGYGLAVDESALTGESAAAEKDPAGPVSLRAPLAERATMAWSGTVVVRGRGEGVAVATGPATELGRVAEAARAVKPPPTPLRVAMRELSRVLTVVALAFSVLVPLLGATIAGQPVREMVLIGLTLAFATIPEELPIIVTMVLGLGAFRLSRRRAVVKRLASVETLGAVTAIASDKTGTITQNRLEVVAVEPAATARATLFTAVLASGAGSLGDRAADPLEVALLRAAATEGFEPGRVRAGHPGVAETPFDGSRGFMSVVYERDDDLGVAVKGAPEAVLARCSGVLVTAERGGDLREVSMGEARRAETLSRAADLASGGSRVIAVAGRGLEGTWRIGTGVTPPEAETGLTFLGLVTLADPPRPEAAAAIEECRAAGIRVLMVTGDHPDTARAVAEAVGLDAHRVVTGPELDSMDDALLGDVLRDTTVFARATPQHKLRLVRALHAAGERVAVTGDGVNDAPALAAADIGVAMGRRGTDVAREAADMVLADDNLATVVHAVEEGRVLFGNLRKAVRYYFACKVALIGASLLPVLLGVPVPFAPIQIILMELFMDLAASATFVAEPPEDDLMRQPPRDPRARFLDREYVTSVLVGAAGLFAAVATAYLVTWYSTRRPGQSHTVAFVTWLLGHVLLAVNMRSEREPLSRLGVRSNPLLLLWGAAAVGLVLVATLVPGVHSALRTVSPTGGQWALAVVAAVIGTCWMEVVKLVRSRPPGGGGGPGAADEASEEPAPIDG